MKDEQMIFRVSGELKAEFQEAADLAHQPAAQVLREFMRTFVKQQRGSMPSSSPVTTQAQRQAAVNFGRGSVALEGFVVSQGAEELSQRFVRGEISMEECITAVKQLHLGT